MLGLCFVLYEALDLFQGCYHHYHQGNSHSSSFIDIEKHNKSVLNRNNKLIKDIIIEEGDLEEQHVNAEDDCDTEEDNGRADDATDESRLVVKTRLGDDFERKNILLKMELLNEKSVILHHSAKCNNEGSFTSNYNGSKSFEYEKLNELCCAESDANDYGNSDYNKRKVFSVSECVL